MLHKLTPPNPLKFEERRSVIACAIVLASYFSGRSWTLSDHRFYPSKKRIVLPFRQVSTHWISLVPAETPSRNPEGHHEVHGTT